MAVADYYRERLSGERLRRCYEHAPPRVRQYLDAEVAYLVQRVRGATSVLELGCGYGRVLGRLVEQGRRVIGIDTSLASLELARQVSGRSSGSAVVAMDAAALGFAAKTFDAAVCVQNGICVFRRDPLTVLREALRAVRSGGIVLFSSYAPAFWPHRLAWFEMQAAEGLVGQIDYAATRPGEIVCRDRFRAGTFGPADFETLASQLGVECRIVAIDASSLFCELTPGAA